VIDVGAEDTLELPPVADQEPVETVATDGADPAFGECVRPRRAKRGADDLDAIQPRTRDLAPKHSQFVAEDDDLEFL
jgi:hypothetical protein